MFSTGGPCKKSESQLVQKLSHQFAKKVSGTNHVSSIGNITVLLDSIVCYGVVQIFLSILTKRDTWYQSCFIDW